MNSSFLLLVLSLLGFVNAFFLHQQFKKYLKTKKSMFCLFGDDCTSVISSAYGTTFGIKNEVMGMCYYLTITTLSLVSSFFGEYSLIKISIFAIGLLAAIFSVYLLYVQSVILKNFCSWCLVAISLNILIFAIVFKNSFLGF